jgi:hypothetical protein
LRRLKVCCTFYKNQQCIQFWLSQVFCSAILKAKFTIVCPELIKIWLQIKVDIWEKLNVCCSMRPRGLRRRSAATPLLGSRVRIPFMTWLSLFCVWLFCVGNELCDKMISCSEKSYAVCVCVCVIVCDLETIKMRRPMLLRHKKSGLLRKKL